MLHLPTLEAIFNGIAIVFMCSAIMAIKNGRRDLHKKLMLCAVASSVCFLVCYLIYHFTHAPVKYIGTHVTFYRVILVTHIALAFVLPYFITITLLRAFREKFVMHKQIARFAFPIWLYVSVTGIVIYFMVHA